MMRTLKMQAGHLGNDGENMTNEYGYSWPERNDDTRCECGAPSTGVCEHCNEYACAIFCHGCQDKATDALLWWWMDSRRPENIIHSAWAHSQNGRDISTPEHEETVMIFQASLAMIRAGWSEAA